MNSDDNKARDREPVHKADGVTPSEKYLNRLCVRSFLSLWSYPGVFRNQKQHGSGDGKELCDMLVVFGNHILIFSDKHCEFPNSSDLILDWKRWYKRAIQSSANQTWGAERWLRSYPKSIYLDRACTEPFPLHIPSPDVAKFHLIVVANGSEDRCKAWFNKTGNLIGSGSLVLNSTLGKSGDVDELTSTPFVVGDLDPTETFVHVLTESTLNILLGTLDTITDFISYLEAKESLFRSSVSILAPGEEDLLALYLMNTDAEGRHVFNFPAGYTIGLEEGFWNDFCQSPQRKNQIEHNKISYMWDGLIERFNEHILNATQYYTNHLELSGIEPGLRFMAAETRTARRAFMASIGDLLAKARDGQQAFKYFKPYSLESPYYLFMFFPRNGSLSYDEYRTVRGQILQASCKILKYKFPDAKDIVGIASEPHYSRDSSEDLIYLDAMEWSDELNDEAAEWQSQLGILESPTFKHTRVDEYPSISTSKKDSVIGSRKVGRNEPCPCGSGKKFKRCHGIS